MRDPDAFMPSDLGVRHGLDALAHDGGAAAAERLSQRWRPYRSYAVQHLWSLLERHERERATPPPQQAQRLVA
jgi:AraC family transcriptional regulator of adaptative response / DNA-3-methyladenine glycosylase II